MRYLGVKKFVERFGPTLDYKAIVRDTVYMQGEVVEHRKTGERKAMHFFFDYGGVMAFSYVLPADYDFSKAIGEQEDYVYLYVPVNGNV